MKRFLFHIVILMAMTCCQSAHDPIIDNEIVDEKEDEGIAYPVDFSAEIVDVASLTDTRASIAGLAQKTKFDYGDSVGILAIKDRYVISDYNNAKYLFTTRRLKPANDEEMPLVHLASDQDSRPSFYSYWPYFESVGDEHQFDVDITDDIADQIDYLATGPTAAVYSGIENDSMRVKFKYKHILTRIKIYVKTDNSDYGTGNCPVINEIQITTNFKQSGIYKIENDTIIPRGDGNSFFVKEGLNVDVLKSMANNGLLGDFVFIPSPNLIRKIVFVGYDENHEPFENAVFDTDQGDRVLAMFSGKSYKLTVNFKKSVSFTQDNGDGTEQGIEFWNTEGDYIYNDVTVTED